MAACMLEAAMAEPNRSVIFQATRIDSASSWLCAAVSQVDNSLEIHFIETIIQLSPRW